MKFTTIETAALSIRKKGSWQPLFKSRFMEKYFDDTKRCEYEKNLFERLFGNNNEDIIMNVNAYPINFGPGLKQYVIWIRNADQNPGIDYVEKYVSGLCSNMDYIVYINKPEFRTIDSILHYHLVIKNSHDPIFLKKLIVFHRHGNREPIYKLPLFENATDSTINIDYDFNSKFLPCGYNSAVEFGSMLKNIYSLDSEFLANAVFLTSPFDRCRDTMKGIIDGFGLSLEINIMDADQLKSEIIDSKRKILPPITKLELLYDDYIDLMTDVENCLSLQNKYTNNIRTPHDKITALTYIYDYCSALQCYQDSGININDKISIKSQTLLSHANKKVNNILCDMLQQILSSEVEKIISFAKNFDNSLVMCSTHDSIVFILAKYFAKENGIDFEFELADYLSNFRIEEWSNATIRIYYNNWYLGSNGISFVKD